MAPAARDDVTDNERLSEVMDSEHFSPYRTDGKLVWDQLNTVKLRLIKCAISTGSSAL